MKRLAFIGAGTHSDAVFPMINFSVYKFVGYFDDKGIASYNSFPILGKVEDAIKYLESSKIDAIFITIGDNNKREEIFKIIKKNHYDKIINIISSSCTILNDKALNGKGIFVGYNAFLGAFVEIGDNSIINTGAVIEHHTKIKNSCNIGPNATINGIVNIGEKCYIGSNSTIIQAISICNNTFLGAATNVVKNIEEPGLYVGNPARLIKKC